MVNVFRATIEYPTKSGNFGALQQLSRFSLITPLRPNTDMSTAQISSPTAQNTPSTPTSQGSLEKAVKFEPSCMSQDEFQAKLYLAGQRAIAQATFILGIAAPGRDESLSDSNYAACEQAALVEVSWPGNNGSKPGKDVMIKAFKSASRLILNEATGLMKVTLRQMSAEAHDAVMASINTVFSSSGAGPVLVRGGVRRLQSELC